MKVPAYAPFPMEGPLFAVPPGPSAMVPVMHTSFTLELMEHRFEPVCSEGKGWIRLEGWRSCLVAPLAVEQELTGSGPQPTAVALRPAGTPLPYDRLVPFPVPRSLSPSRVETFTNCPLQFRLGT